MHQKLASYRNKRSISQTLIIFKVDPSISSTTTSHKPTLTPPTQKLYNKSYIMNKCQKQIQEFSRKRDWDKFHNPKDLLLGIVEEIGELRNIIKWEQDLAKIKKALKDNKVEVEDHVGDIYWFLALLANSAGIDIDKAIGKTIKDNEKRFPVKDIRSKHTNRYLGGKDKKYDS